MRVVIFSETFLPAMDGIVRVMCLLLDHLHQHGIETLVIAPQLGDEPVTEYNSSKVVTVAGPPIPWYPERRMTLPSPTVYRALKEFQPDVAHFFHPVTIGLPGLLMVKQLGIPTLISFHLDFAQMATHFKYGFISLSFLKSGINLLTRFVFNSADYTLAPSRAMQCQMHKLGIQNVGLWKRGVDAERFHPRYRDAAMRQRLSDGHPDDIVLLYVGRLSQEKYLQDIRPVMDSMPNVRLALVGDGPYRQDLERIFTGTNTVFTGYLRDEALSQAYASADIFVFPSSLETFGLVVVEAMAAGLPVVASRVGGIPDVLEEGATGYTFAIGDKDGLLDGLRRIVANRETMQQMGRNARAFAETQTWGHMMDEVIVHYERIIHHKFYELSNSRTT
ncbi:MAG: glycosyltransferase family 1 protein [Anaerolineae bacterium]|nr:glycosyltransferase family 1 protein [Anaerolineae bacterium]